MTDGAAHRVLSKLLVCLSGERAVEIIGQLIFKFVTKHLLTLVSGLKSQVSSLSFLPSAYCLLSSVARSAGFDFIWALYPGVSRYDHPAGLPRRGPRFALYPWLPYFTPSA